MASGAAFEKKVSRLRFWNAFLWCLWQAHQIGFESQKWPDADCGEKGIEIEDLECFSVVSVASLSDWV